MSLHPLRHLSALIGLIFFNAVPLLAQSATLSERISAHEAAEVEIAVVELRRIEFALALKESGKESLRTALAEADLAKALRDVYGNEREVSLAEARKLFDHAAPVLASQLSPLDPRARTAAGTFYQLHHDDPGLVEAPPYIHVALHDFLPQYRLPSALESKQLAAGDERGPAQLAILKKTLGPDHPATANLRIRGWDNENLQRAGLDKETEQGFRRLAELHLQESTIAVHLPAWIRSLFDAGRDDDAMRLMHIVFDGQPPDESVQRMAELLASTSRVPVEQFYRRFLELITQTGQVSPQQVRLYELEALRFRKEGPDKARLLLSELETSRADAVMIAKVRAILAAMLARSTEQPALVEARKLASEALPQLVSNLGARDPASVAAWAALVKAAKGAGEDPQNVLSALPLGGSAPIRVPSLIEAQRIAELDQLTHRVPPDAAALNAAVELVSLEDTLLGANTVGAAEDWISLGIIQFQLGKDGSAALRQGLDTVGRARRPDTRHQTRLVVRATKKIAAAGYQAAAERELSFFVSTLPTPAAREAVWRAVLDEAAGDFPAGTALAQQALIRDDLALALVDAKLAAAKPTSAFSPPAPAATIDALDAQIADLVKGGKLLGVQDLRRRAYEMRVARDGAASPSTLLALSDLADKSGFGANGPQDRGALLDGVSKLASSRAAISALDRIASQWAYLDKELTLAAAKRALVMSEEIFGRTAGQTAIAAMHHFYRANEASLSNRWVILGDALARISMIAPASAETRDRLLTEGRAAQADAVRESFAFAFFVSAWTIDRALGGDGKAIAKEAAPLSRVLTEMVMVPAYQAALTAFDARGLAKDSGASAELVAKLDRLPANSPERTALEDQIIETNRLALVENYGRDSAEVQAFLAQNIYHYLPKDDGSLAPTSNKERSLFYVDEIVRLAELRQGKKEAKEIKEIYSFYLKAFGDTKLTEIVLAEARAVSDQAGDDFAKARSLDDLIKFYNDKKDFFSAEPLLRQKLEQEIAASREQSSPVAAMRVKLGDNLRRQGRDNDARAQYQQAIAIRTQLFGPDEAITKWTSDRLAMIATTTQPDLADTGPDAPFRLPATSSGARPLNDSKDHEVEALRLAVRKARRTDGGIAEAAAIDGLISRLSALQSDKVDTAEEMVAILSRRAQLREAVGDFTSAEADRRRALAIAETSIGANSATAAETLSALASALDQQGRALDAEPLHRRAAAIIAEMYTETSAAARIVGALATNLELQGRAVDAEPLRRKAIAEGELRTEYARAALMRNLLLQKKPDEAREIFDDVGNNGKPTVAIAERSEDPAFVIAVTEMLIQLGRPLAAQRVASRLVAVQASAFGEDSFPAAEARALLGEALFEGGNPSGAKIELERACAALALLGRNTAAGEIAERRALERTGRCARTLALALRAAGSTSSAYEAAAFEATQRAELSSAGRALTRAGARSAASVVGAGPLVAEYEAALTSRRDLDVRLAEAVAASQTKEASERRAKLLSEQATSDRHLAMLVASIRKKQPRYWDLRSPEPIPIADLQAKSGADAALLRDNELLLSFLTPPGGTKGLVFAVSKASNAWAQIGMSGDELSAVVMRLREEIDPEAYGATGNGEYVEPFDRTSAHKLYKALVGTPEIAAMVAKAEVLLFVPSGPLTSFPPALLVQRPPTGQDDNPMDLRATSWLLRDKAIAVLPSVSSLRTMRQLLPAPRKTTIPLQGFADPDFKGVDVSAGEIASADKRQAMWLSTNSYFRSGQVDRAVFEFLPQLPGTRIEGEALSLSLGAGANSVLFGADASEERLRRLDANGTLAQARVIAFSTHGLIAGEFAKLAEPALALARPRAGSAEDGLLLASEAASLHLTADWVLLSACNTASPNGDTAEGLSGLSRSFLFAGARSLLASHWRVSDAAAAAIVAGIFSDENRSVSKAQALRAASLAVLDDIEFEGGSEPSAWAPFVLIGSPD